MGTSADRAMSPEQEARIGAEFLRRLRQHVEIMDDPEVRAYIQSLGKQLVSHSRDQGPTDFHFFVVGDTRVNAFAAPGGYIGINAGLILEARREDELAGVIAHEIAHVTQRHLARSGEAAEQMSIPLAASILAAVLLGSQDPQLGQAALAASIAGSAQYQISFTRQNEREADRVGMDMLARAGFDPEGMPGFFERMQASNRFGASVVPEFMLTHPVTLNRIADSRSRARQYDYTPRESHGDFEHIQARVRVLTARDNREVVNLFREEVAKHDGTDWARYGLALALRGSGDIDKALTLMAELRSEQPDRLAYRLAHARLLAADGDEEAALSLYRETLELFPGNEAATLHLATTLLERGAALEARRLLRDFTRRHEHGVDAYLLRARAEAASGDTARYHATLAEYYNRSGRMHEAIRQLRHALTASHDPDLSRRLEARMADYRRTARIQDELEALQEAQEQDE